jgi:hypothetical protein
LHADGDVLVFFLAGDDAEREDGTRIFHPSDDVPALCFEDFDMPVESACEKSRAITGECETGDGLLVVLEEMYGLRSDDVEDADDVVGGS